jgi:hypothetical protein
MKPQFNPFLPAAIAFTLAVVVMLCNAVDVIKANHHGHAAP